VAVNRTTIMNSSGALDLADRRRLLPVSLESALATPLCARDLVVGVLTLYGAARDAFTSEHQQVVEFAARQIGPALERALSFEQNRMASLFDVETGLPNERYLERVLASAVYCGPVEGPRPGILILVDVNGGDAVDALHQGSTAPGRADVLLRLAATARMAVRVTDLVFRTGEHEVTILMSDSTAEAMETVARRVTEAMGDVAGEGLTASIESTFALLPDHASGPGDLLRAARARRQQLLRCPS
jgi:GGDEF domain-containing protein